MFKIPAGLKDCLFALAGKSRSFNLMLLLEKLYLNEPEMSSVTESHGRINDM